jgi:guanylate kinase
MSKLIVLTAPSGAGKTTIVRHLLKTFDDLAFSVSATTRRQREGEVDGRDYYFLSEAEFRTKIKEQAFVEWEEVYQGQFYGTLKTEIERLWQAGKHIIFDIDVQGALNIKEHYPEQTLTIFVKPPSEEVLFNRLRQRNTETPENLRKRMEKASLELSFENKCDKTLVNDVLTEALAEAERIVQAFTNSIPNGDPDHK